MILKVPVAEPAAIVAFVTVTKLGLLVLSGMVVWPITGPVSFTVPVKEFPASTAVPLVVMLSNPGASMVNVPDVEMFPCVAVIVASVSLLTGVVLIVNVADVWPLVTLQVAAASLASLELDAKSTVTPLVGAAAVSVTVPVAEAPPPTDLGKTETLLSPTTERLAETVFPSA